MKTLLLPWFSRIIALIAVCSIASMLMGCATIIRGSSQEVLITSEPSGARIKINGTPKGSTPLNVRLPRGNNQYLQIDAPEYETYEITLESYFRPYAMLNIPLLIIPPIGIVGVIVDKINRADYTYTPNAVNAVLVPAENQITQQK